MAIDYLSYWKPATVERQEGSLLDHAASDQYGSINHGDTVWIVTAWPGGHLVLLGRIRVDAITGQAEAEQRLGTDDVWTAKHHIFSAAGDAEPMREVELTDIAASFRFESKHDRLKISEGQVNAMQLQSMRRLTPETASMLRARWEEDSAIAAAVQETQARSSGGAGFGDAASNREVERAGVDYVTDILRGEGWTVRSVEAERKGFDLLCQRNGEQRHVEVKGVRGNSPSFVITEGELRRVERDPRFWLYVVTNALDSPTAHSMSGEEAIKRYRFVPLAHRALPFAIAERD